MHDGKRLCGGFRSPLMLAITAFITPYFCHLKTPLNCQRRITGAKHTSLPKSSY